MIPGRRVVFGPLLAIVVTTVVSACASGLPRVDPADIPGLEQQAAARPDDTDLRVRLGMAHFQAGDYDAARVSLRGAVDAGNESGAAFLYLGMTEEELQDWTAARAAYTRYLEAGASREGREEVRRRLTTIGRNLLRAQAAQALAQETEITATGNITPRSVAVMPLGFNSDREELEPLIYALSDMMITDFKVSNALVVLERAQVQALLDEMALTSAGYSDAETGARAGRMLRAEHVVQGVLTTLDADELQTDADILNVPAGGSAGQLTESAQLERLFDMEKQIVIRTIRDVLGVTLTPAEEQAILENRMQNVLAFVAYGRGLRLLDQGDYVAAQAAFDEAASLEPGGYQGLELASLEAAAMADAAGTSTSDLATIAGASGEFSTGLFAPPLATTTTSLAPIGIPDPAPVGAGSDPALDPGAPPPPTTRNAFKTLSNVHEGVFPTPTAITLGLSSSELVENPATGPTQPANRDPIQEATGSETVEAAAAAQIRIVIQRPGGAQ